MKLQGRKLNAFVVSLHLCCLLTAALVTIWPRFIIHFTCFYVRARIRTQVDSSYSDEKFLPMFLTRSWWHFWCGTYPFCHPLLSVCVSVIYAVCVCMCTCVGLAYSVRMQFFLVSLFLTSKGCWSMYVGLCLG